MKFLIYCIYDRVAGLYAEPFIIQKEELAVRKFNYIMSTASMVANDCELYCLGTYDSETGKIIPVSPSFVCKYNSEVK